MPSPKAVLRDINDLKLDPKVAHTGTKASGRLKHPASPVVVEAPPVKAPEKKHVEAPKAKDVVKEEPFTPRGFGALPPTEVSVPVEVEKAPEVKGDGVTDDTAAIQALLDAPVKNEQVAGDNKPVKKKDKKANKPSEPTE